MLTSVKQKISKGIIKMSEYDYTYVLPDNFQQGIIRFLDLNGKKELANLLKSCKIYYDDLGYAYYAGMRGDNWNKKALDFTIESSESIITNIKRNQKILAEMIQKFIKPSVSGYLVRNIEFIIIESELSADFSLPEKTGDDFATLYRDIHDALAKDEPVLVLDRLHTFSMKYFRTICQNHGIEVSAPDGQLYPLHSLVGNLTKYYDQNNLFGSDFSKKAMKMSISLFDSYNAIRNDKSFAHDNDLLSKREASYVVRILADTIKFIEEIENV